MDIIGVDIIEMMDYFTGVVNIIGVVDHIEAIDIMAWWTILG